MANTNRPATARRSRTSARNTGGIYVDGNTARRLQEIPERRYYPPASAPVRKSASPQALPRQTVQKGQTLSREAQKNRAKAANMSRGFVAFIAVAAAAVLFCCIHYLQLKAQYTGKISQVAVLESELAQLREDNDAYESQVTSNVDLSRIKKIAIGRLGMKYPSDEESMTYTTQGGSYVRQYQDIPDTKGR